MSQCIAKTNDDVEDFTKGCQAKEYDNCDGWHSVINVLFLYRDSKGRHREDEHVKIGVCEYHRKWLVKLHNGFPLEMRGEEPYYAMHDDLFIPFFAQDNTIYTLLQIDLCAPLPNKDDNEEKANAKSKRIKANQHKHGHMFLSCCVFLSCICLAVAYFVVPSLVLSCLLVLYCLAVACIVFNAATISFVPLIPAGSAFGPISTKSLYITGLRSSPKPSSTNFTS